MSSDSSKSASPTKRKPFLLSASILDKFSLGKHRSSDITVPESLRFIPPSIYRSNAISYGGLLDTTWDQFICTPDLATTSLFRLFLGLAEHLFQSLTLLESALHPAIYDHWHRADNLEFVIAARGWSQCVRFGKFEDYKKRFAEVGKLGSEMIKAVMETEVIREEEERRDLEH